MSRASDGYHCCWPGQAYVSSKQACVGTPSCPSGYAAAGGNSCRSKAEIAAEAARARAEAAKAKAAAEAEAARVKVEAARVRELAARVRDAEPGSPYDDPYLGRMVWAPEGSFEMGSRGLEAGRMDDERLHDVRFSHGFWIAAHEVTQGAWQRLMGEDRSTFTTVIAGQAGKTCRVTGSLVLADPEYPAICVDWADAVAFANKLSAVDGLEPAYDADTAVAKVRVGASGYRLPTEAEWEYAARAGTRGPFGGDSSSDSAPCVAGNVADLSAKEFFDGWTTASCSDNAPGLARVGSYAPNGWGVYDMLGNVGEWTGDWYAKHPEGGADPAGPDSGAGRVYRGGTWNNKPVFNRLAARIFRPSSSRDINLGLRLVRPVSAAWVAAQEAKAAEAARAAARVAAAAEAEALAQAQAAAEAKLAAQVAAARARAEAEAKEARAMADAQARTPLGPDADGSGDGPAASPDATIPAPFTSVDAPAPTSEPVASGPIRAAGEEFTSPALGAMIWLGPGTFAMGTANTDSGDAQRHEVSLTRGFWMMEHEVTQDEWAAVMFGNPSYYSQCGPRCPVDQVSWEDAQDFARRLSESEGLTCRLPTEAEWEYAARFGGGMGGAYAGSSEPGGVAWYDKTSGGAPHQGCKREPTRAGFCDLSGNVSEWTADWYGPYLADAVSDPGGPESGSARVARGGSWGDDKAAVQVTSRARFAPDTRFRRLGFRLVCEAP